MEQKFQILINLLVLNENFCQINFTVEHSLYRCLKFKDVKKKIYGNSRVYINDNEENRRRLFEYLKKLTILFIHLFILLLINLFFLLLLNFYVPEKL